MYSLVAKIKDVIGDRLGLRPSPQLFLGNDDRIEMHGQPKPPIKGPGRATSLSATRLSLLTQSFLVCWESEDA